MDPVTATFTGINTAANLAGTVGGFLGQGGAEGLSRQDQRYLAHMAQIQQEKDNDYRMNQMKYRTQDAMNAGLHPLAALGIMPSPGGQAPQALFQGSKDTLGDKLQRMGQNVTRAISTYQTPEQRAVFQTELDNAKKQGNLIDAQTADIYDQIAKRPGTPPPAPPDGSMTNPKPKYIAYRNQDGTISYHYNPEFAASIMSDPLQMYGQSFRNVFRASETGGFPWQGTWNEIKAAAKRLGSPLRVLDLRDWRR